MANGHSSHDSRSVGASTPKVESVKTTHNSPPRSSPDSSTCGEPLVLLNYIKHNGASPFVERHQENINQPLQRLHTKQPDFYGHDNLPLFESHMSLSPEHRLDDSTTRDTETFSRGRSVVDRASTAQSNSGRSLQENARQDSGYHDEKIDVELQARNIRARERVEIHRGRVWRTRRLLNESRQDVQKPRARLRDATAELMAALDTLMATGDLHQLESLVPFHQEVRGAQDELGPLEDVLDTLEIRLNHEESELEQEEMHFYRNYNISLEPPSDSKLDEPLSPLYKPYEPDDEYDDLDLENELVQQYLSSKGEAENLKEKIDELEDEQYRISTERTFRTRYNLPLSEENSKFLLTFPDTHKEALDKLQLLEDQLAELRRRCLENELFGEDDYLYEPRDAFVEEVMDSVNEALERSPLRAASLQHTPTLSSREKNYSDKREYVNKWLLEWVQDSMLEAHMLKEWIYSEYPASRDGLEAEQWPTLALEFWDSDKAGEKTNLFYELDTREAVSGSQTSRGSSLDANIEDDILGSFENFCYSGSDGASQRTQRGAHIVGSSKASSW